MQTHRDWWHAYYPRSFVTLPDKSLESLRLAHTRLTSNGAKRFCFAPGRKVRRCPSSHRLRVRSETNESIYENKATPHVITQSVCAMSVLLATSHLAASAPFPVPERGFVSSQPAKIWEEGLICGNGTIGAN